MAKLSYKVSYYIMYICFALILVVLGMFYFVGYNNPVGEYNAPEHTETLIYLMYAMFGICVAVTVIGAIAQFGAALRDNPKSAIKSLIGLVLFVVVLVVSYGMGSDSPVVLADGSAYTDTGWLKITDMLIYSIYFLFGVAAIGTLVNLSGMLPERKSVLITCFMNHTVSQQRSTAGRFVKWKEAINIFGLFPATGVGGGNYALASDTYRQERQGLFTSYATNTYLQVAAEKGIVGVIVYGALVLSLIYIGIHQMKKGELRSIVFFSILLALGVREVTFSSFFQKENMMILCFLIMVSLVQPLEDNYELFK